MIKYNFPFSFSLMIKGLMMKIMKIGTHNGGKIVKILIF